MTNEFGFYFLGCLILGFLVGVILFLSIKRRSPIVANEQVAIDSGKLYTNCSLHKIRNDSREVGKCNRSILELSVYEVISEESDAKNNENLSFRGISFDFDK